jgi:hypothetical protein
MDLQTKWMRDGAGPQKEIHAYKGPQFPGDAEGADLWHGIEYVNHPTPSGCERWLPTLSDKRGWPDAKTAIKEMEKSLKGIK